MKIMEQLLMFCSNQYASNLIIYTDDTQSEALGIYREFLVTEGYPLPQVVDNPEISILINEKTIHSWAKYMNKVK